MISRVDEVPEWFDIPIYESFSCAMIFICIYVASYRMLNLLFKPVGLNWFKIMQFIMI